MHLRLHFLVHALLIAGSLNLRIAHKSLAKMLAANQSGDGSRSALTDAAKSIEFFRIVGQLKKLKRTGWVKRGVDLPESVSDHMYRMSMCSFLLSDPAVDRMWCTKMALVHDLAEALAGDITPHCGVSEAEKRRREEAALDNILETVPSPEIGNEIRELWLEYESGSTPEAIFVKDLDKFEMILQADEYERGQNKDLSEFFKSTEGYFKTQQVQQWDQELRAQRAARLQKRGGETEEGPGEEHSLQPRTNKRKSGALLKEEKDDWGK
uniref:5'-deoxynucleotidase n=1 Tax=Heterosigma akashiwo TaxID=2829 RepID=A0A7S3XU85_HETAK|mmetsp:Transcript_26552/g.45733  ORF Transcript_26552/g.45733 Transcript_26552/m.45733 type:complete len:267 (-) Transcript_26552:136-936(-)